MQIARCHSEEAEWDKGRSYLESRACRASHEAASYLQGRHQDEEDPPGYGTNLSQLRATGRSEVLIWCTPFVFTPPSALLPPLPDHIIPSHSDNSYFSCTGCGVGGPKSTCLRLFVDGSVYDVHTLVALKTLTLMRCAGFICNDTLMILLHFGGLPIFNMPTQNSRIEMSGTRWSCAGSAASTRYNLRRADFTR